MKARVMHDLGGPEVLSVEQIPEPKMLSPPMPRILSLQQAAEAHRLIETGHSIGKLVLRV